MLCDLHTSFYNAMVRVASPHTLNRDMVGMVSPQNTHTHCGYSDMVGMASHPPPTTDIYTLSYGMHEHMLGGGTLELVESGSSYLMEEAKVLTGPFLYI